IDVGRRRVRAAVADITGAVVARRDEPARASRGRTLIRPIRALGPRLGGAGAPGPHSPGAGAPGGAERARASSARTLIGQIGAIAHGLAAEAGIGWDQVQNVTVGSPRALAPTRGARS